MVSKPKGEMAQASAPATSARRMEDALPWSRLSTHADAWYVDIAIAIAIIFSQPFRQRT